MEYIVIKTLALHAGEIGLSNEQAAPRMHNLKKIGDGLYSILSPVQFKIGEKISLKGAQKGQEQYLQDARAEAAAARDEEEARQAAAKVAEEEAAKKTAEEETAKKGSKKAGKK